MANPQTNLWRKRRWLILLLCLVASWTLRQGLTKGAAEQPAPAALAPFKLRPYLSPDDKFVTNDGAAREFFGAAVALSGDTAAVGAPSGLVGGVKKGAVYVFRRAGQAWAQEAKITADDGAANADFGASAALAGDTLLVGDPAASAHGAGAVYVFTRAGNVWTQRARLTPADSAAGNRFGFALALSGATAVVGAPAAPGANAGSGAAYVFTGGGANWTQQAKLAASDGASNDSFGVSVALDGDTALVGAATAGGQRPGAGYVFTRNGANWSEQQKLTAADGAAADLFGGAVALSGDTAALGAAGQDINGVSNQGAAYVFTRNGASWQQEQKLTAHDGAASDEFGWALHLSGGKLLVGAPAGRRSGNGREGAAYVFAGNGAGWSALQKLTASDGANADDFGAAVAIDGATALIGAATADAANQDQGATYLAKIGGPVWTGAASNDWHNAANWAGNNAPANGDTVIIPANATNPPAINNADVTLDNLNLGAGATLNVGAGRALAINGLLTLGGNLNAGASGLVSLGADALINPLGGFVAGRLRKAFNGQTAFTYPVGTLSRGAAAVTLFAVSGAGHFTVSANDGTLPGYGNPNALNRYWSLTNGGLSSLKLTFNYQTGDVAGNAAVYRIVKDTDGNGAPFSFPDNDADNVDETARTATTVNPVTQFSNWSLAELAGPTLARVEKFDGYRFPAGNLVRWQSSFETKNLGFLVYRQRNAGCGAGNGNTPPAACLEQLTPGLIAGSALRFGGDTVLTAGNSYSWWDTNGAADSRYWVEDVDLSGAKTLHGPVQIADCGLRIADCATVAALRPQSSRLLGEISSATVANNTGGYPADFSPPSALRPPPSEDAWRRQQQLASGPALKITVTENGWQRVNGAQLAARGLPPAADAKLLQVYLEGVEQPLAVRTSRDTEDGPLGADGVVEFYGTGRDTRESDANVYWLIVGDAPGLRVGPPVRVAPGSGGDKQAHAAPPKRAGRASKTQSAARSFPYTVTRQDRSFYFAPLNNGEDNENFFGAVINGNTVTQTIEVNKLDADAAATSELALQGATEGPHQVRVELNGQLLGVANFNGQTLHTARFAVAPGNLREGANLFTLRALDGGGDVSLTSYLRLTYARRYETGERQFLFASDGRRSLVVRGFQTAAPRVFDVTDPARVFPLAVRVSPEATRFAVTIPGQLSSRLLLAVEDGAALAPARLENNAPSAWSDANQAADFVIVTPRAFRSALEPLAALRSGQGLRTALVNLEDVYDEWGFGVKSAAALRGFLRFAHERWQSGPRYVLLVGDASYDPRDYLGFGDADVLPTGYVATSQLETASDEALADFDGDGVGEMAVGRLPARSLEQAQAIVEKLLRYTPQPANGALLVADRPEGYDFAAANQALRPLLPQNMPVTTVNRANGTDTQTRQQILAAFNAGPSLAVYSGHGSVEVWTGAGLLQTSDIAALANGPRLPLVSLMTCLNGYFADLHTESLGEALLKAPNGGAAAVWASSGLTSPASQAQLNRAFIRALYRTPTAAPRLGDAALEAKRATPDQEARQTWLLFGDPTTPAR
jgi:hypothetical protein